MNTNRIERELEFYSNALKALNEIPNDYRSQNHSAYLNELEERVYELNEALNFVHERE